MPSPNAVPKSGGASTVFLDFKSICFYATISVTIYTSRQKEIIRIIINDHACSNMYYQKYTYNSRKIFWIKHVRTGYNSARFFQFKIDPSCYDPVRTGLIIKTNSYNFLLQFSFSEKIKNY